MPTDLAVTEGNMEHGTNRKPCSDPTRSKTLSMPGSDLFGSWEIWEVPAKYAGGADKVNSRNPAINAPQKSDTPMLPGKPSNKGKPAEMVEGRGVAKGNAKEAPTDRAQHRAPVSMGLQGIREAARRDKGCKFTALLHHITRQLLIESFYALKRDAAVGVDGVTWQEYEEGLFERVQELHRKIHTGAYKAKPSRRVHIPKADGKQRPLGIASLEDKIVQQALTSVLNMIYEEDFLGFSYGFRQGRSQHDALDALTVGVSTRNVNWILDADIQAFFDTIDHEWMMRLLEHRIADKRVLRLIAKWLKAGVHPWQCGFAGQHALRNDRRIHRNTVHKHSYSGNASPLGACQGSCRLIHAANG